MSSTIRLVLALHNHQPVGNFDGVFEQSYQESYRPFLDVFDEYPSLPISLHVSGSLMEWLEVHHPEYVDRLAGLVASGRIEMLGGAYYEAILPMIPPRDRVGQITRYTDWLRNRLGATVRGMWIPERVWEPSLVSDLAAAGIKYTVLDDFHFRNAGLTPDQLHGYYVTEDNGNVVSVFPGSERLRYLVPFADPRQTIDYLGGIAAEHPGSVIVFGDDGEKFGTWPDTHKHVYHDRWLHRFFDALVANESWIKTTTLSEAIEHVAPTGKIYLPNASYREMTEWALPFDRIQEFDHLKHDLEADPRWPALSQFVQGGFWRNFKVKYPESDEMYSRMLMISNQLHVATQQQLVAGEASSEVPAPERQQLLDQARTELYRGQCNCPYWHGAFGGIYLPHLRHAIFNHLIASENLLHKAAGRTGPFVEAVNADFNCDARPEVLLSNDKLAALFSPVRGGRMYELDVRSICLNLLGTLARRPEAYHEKVLAGNKAAGENVASIHERVVFKQAGLDQRLQYDRQLRKSLVDHFWDNEVCLDSIARNEAPERGDFAVGGYEATIRRSPDRVQIKLTRLGNAWGHPFRITKAVTMQAGSPTLSIVYQLEDLPRVPLHFGVEFNFAGLPSGCEDRYFRSGADHRWGQLESRLDLEDVQDLSLVDEWLGIDVGLMINRPSHIWTFPIETVSQSEGGFELVHQSVMVQPHWIVEPDAGGKWRVGIQLTADTALAESRMQEHLAMAEVV